MRHALALVTLVGVGMAPAVAAAQEECPPGGWFCEEGDAPAEGAEGSPPEGSNGAAEGDDAAATEPSSTVVVVTPPGEPPPKVVVIGEPTEPPPPPEPVARTPFHEWGFNLHLETALLGSDAGRAGASGMGGLGFSFRYRAVPHFAFEAGVDFVGGKDWQGNRRSETALLFNGLVFFNPRDPVQFYMLGGFGWSGAEVRLESSEVIAAETMMSQERRHYAYFGGQLGAGLEFRVGKRTALNLDLIGFMRGRTDSLADQEPEFVDPNDPNVTTNTSGGGLLRGGITFYW